MKICTTCHSNYPSHFSVCPRDGAGLFEAGAWAEGVVIRGKDRILGKAGQGGMGALRGSFALTTPPGAQVLVDGMMAGTVGANGKLVVNGVGTGNHVLRLQGGGFNGYDYPVTIPAGETVLVTAQASQQGQGQPASQPASAPASFACACPMAGRLTFGPIRPPPSRKRFSTPSAAPEGRSQTAVAPGATRSCMRHGVPTKKAFGKKLLTVQAAADEDRRVC